MNKKFTSKDKRFFSVTSSVVLILSTLIVGISVQIPNTSAASVNHTVGNLDIRMLMDYGRILYPISWSGYQTVQNGSSLGFTGLVIDQDNYNHASGAEDIADCFNITSPYLTPDDFRSAKDITMVVDDGTTQRSFCSFINKGSGTGDSHDILINQTCWTVKNKDWAIIQWTLINVKSPSSTITNVRIGLEVQISKEGGRYGLGGNLDDGGDDIDNFDAGNAVYWAQDKSDSTTIGFGSAIVTDPISHYYAKDYHVPYSSEYVNFFGNDTWLYQRLLSPNATATNGVTPGNITATIGWDGFDILPGEFRTVALVIAMDDSYANMITALKDAQNYYLYQGPGFRITEFSDSSSVTQQIEVFNYGNGLTDLPAEGYFLSVDGGANSLAGTWINNPLPPYQYAVFTLNPGEIIGAEGDTIGLYQDLGGGNKVRMDEISFGQEGVAPDPIAGESTARIYYPSIEEYSIYWTRATTPSFGAQNDVPSINSNPSVILNEVMFNPSIDPDGKYLVIINKEGVALNVANYCIVCDDSYTLPSIVIPPYSSQVIDYTTAPLLFNFMTPNGDNVYLYDNSGQLLDMVGWNTPHNQGMSARRVPNGFGTYQGYDDISSVAAGWVFNSPLKVLMTEISDDGSTQAKIEVYNPWYSIIDFSIGYTFESGSTPPGPLSGAWALPTANTGEHAVFNVNGGLDTEGDTISLYQNGELIEEISYGQKGLVPDPLNDESVQRYWDGSQYTNLWERNWTSGPNFGTKNNVPISNPASPVSLNEVLFNPSDVGNYYVEVVSKNGIPVDISGWKIVCDKEYTIPQGIFLNLNQRFFYLLYNMQQQFFEDPINGMGSSGDNVYLYDENGSLVDMVGWNSAHNIDGTVCRFPEANGTRDGYDDVSSMAAGWLFNCTPSIRLVKIDINRTVHEKPIGYGHIGGNVIFNLTILNLQQMDDIIHFLNSSQEGWTVRIFDETGNLEIENITVNANGTLNIIVKVTLPDDLSSTFMDNITIIIRSSNSKLIQDSIVLNARVYPFLNLTKNSSQSHIFLNGTGHDEITTITLETTGMGIQGTRTYIDCVFCIDSSGSMTSTDPNGLRKSESQNFVLQNFRGPDRAAVVDFDSDAYLQPNGWLIGDHLSSDYGKIIVNIGLIDSSGGTSVSAGLNMSNEELRLYGQPVDHAPIIILITDAQTGGDQQACLKEANIAASRGVIIFTIGLKTNGTQYEQLLKDIATITGGMYFEAPNASHFKYIYEIISGILKDIAAWDNDTTDPDPLLRDVLPWYVDYVPGSFSIQPDKIYKDNITGETFLEWNLPWIKFGETWSVSFDVKLNLPGMRETNVYEKSRAFYTTWDNKTDTVLFPRCKVYVLTPAPLPPKLYIDILPNKNDISLYWDDPLSSATDRYLIYRSPTPTGFDFSSPWIDTSVNLDPLDPGGIAVGNRLSWNHTGAADPTNLLEYSEQWYYCIRSVNNMGEMSRTSRTVGKWTREFTQAGVSSFSLPLEPLETMTPTADFFVNDMGANYIKWMDPGTHDWMIHGGIHVNDTPLEVGRGYEVEFGSSINYTFLGMPGSHIMYKSDSFMGFDYLTEADSLDAYVPNPISGDVILNWTQPSDINVVNYNVYRSTKRDGFDNGFMILLATLPRGTETYIDFGVAASEGQYYYMVVPLNGTGAEGASTYSIGVWTEEYLAQYDTIGIPLKLIVDETADWYCDNIPNTVGINYYIHSEQRWCWHSTRMPAGAYDPMLVMVEGYQISTTGPTRFTFIGR
jgi:Mg-chelatase subunit ChlD